MTCSTGYTSLIRSAQRSVFLTAAFGITRISGL
jgi:hypothetical protein